jgi:rhamnosyltransferase
VVTVTYNPDLAVLRRQFASLQGAGVVVVVDNASAPALASPLREAVAAIPNAVLLANARNEGLAAALNAGAAAAFERLPDCACLLFLDQDTEPGEGDVQRLIDAARALKAIDPGVGLVGPQMFDAATGLSHGIHVIRGWRWMRVFPAAGETHPTRCASINGSGMVVPAEVFRKLGGFDETFFIDHVDSEFSFRAAYAGYRLFTIPQVRFAHRMGERSLRFWLGGWRVWPHRSPQRHYHLFRNAVRLLRRPYVPRVWKLWVVPKLALTALVHACADSARGPQLRAMVAGIRAGLAAAPLEPRRAAANRGSF